MQNLNISSYDFEQLKRYFDQNDVFGGADFLTMLMRRPFEAWAQADYYSLNNSDQNGYSDLYGLPFSLGDGLEWKKDYAKNKLQLCTSEEDDAVSDIAMLRNELNFLRAAVADLQKMHQEGGAHVPTIISTKEQALALKDKINREERVLLHTSFDKALKAFE